jgi:hypothetical protein
MVGQANRQDMGSVRKSIGQAVEYDVALPLGRKKTVTLGQAVEHDTALPITAVVGSAIAYVTVQTTVVHVPPPEPAFHVAHGHEDFVAGGAEVALVLATLVVGGRQVLHRVFHVRPDDII